MTRIVEEEILEQIKLLGPQSSEELALLTGRSTNVITQALRRGRKRAKDPLKIYISHWEKPSGGRGRNTPFYAIGDKPDKEKPPAPTKREYERSYYARNKAAAALKKLSSRGSNSSVFRLNNLFGTTFI